MNFSDVVWWCCFKIVLICLERGVEIFRDEMARWMACASKSSSGGDEVGRGQDAVNLAVM